MTTNTDLSNSRLKQISLFIQDQDLWPMWPLLCLKRMSIIPGTSLECGVMTSDEPTTVYTCNIYDIAKRGNFEGLSKIKYESLDLLIDDGWEID